MKNRLLKYFVFVFCFCIAWVGGMCFAYLNLGMFDESVVKFSEINKFVKNNYLYELDDGLLFDRTLTEYVKSLDDRYAKYYNAAEWEKFEKESEGVFNGIGVKIEVVESGNVKIVSVFDGSPAARAGIEAGDLIIKINDIEVSGLSLADVADILHSEDADEFDIVFSREGQEFSKTLTVEICEVPSIEYCMDGYGGYIKIISFNSSTVTQFKDALEKLQNDGAKYLIFDLRNNGGGTLDSVCRMLNMLIPSGVIATQVTAKGEEVVIGRSDEGELNLPMATITNKNTASASELFVCDLKDYNKASQVGQTTYGKGVLQTVKRFSSGVAVKITTAYFNPAKSGNFNEIGVKPDVEVFLDEKKEYLYLKGKLKLADDDQYQAAVRLLKDYIKN